VNIYIYIYIYIYVCVCVCVGSSFHGMSVKLLPYARRDIYSLRTRSNIDLFIVASKEILRLYLYSNIARRRLLDSF